MYFFEHFNLSTFQNENVILKQKIDKLTAKVRKTSIEFDEKFENIRKIQLLIEQKNNEIKQINRKLKVDQAKHEARVLGFYETLYFHFRFLFRGDRTDQF